MGLMDRVLAKLGHPTEAVNSEAIEEIAKHYKLGRLDEEDCDACGVCYPSSLSIDEASPLFNSAAPVSAQILVATGQSNWKHDIADENTGWGLICKKLGGATDKLEAAAGGKIRINGTDAEAEDDDEKVEVIVLPHFARVMTDSQHCVEDVVSILGTQPGSKLPGNASPVPERGFIMLCSHRQRDKRCGITAPLMKQALDIELRHQDLYRDPDDDEPGGVRVIFCNHVGGHKFAANALIYQNQGMALMLARLRPEHAKFVVEKTLGENTVAPELVRTCNRLKSYQW